MNVCDLFFNVVEPIYPKLEWVGNTDTTTIILLFSHNLINDLTTVKNAFTITDSIGKSFTVLETRPGVNNAHLVLKTSTFGGFSGNLTVTYNRGIIPLDVFHEGSLFGIDSFTINFTPEIEPRLGFEFENLSFAIVEPIFESLQVTNKNVYLNESLSTLITDVSFVVIKVGDAPL